MGWAWEQRDYTAKVQSPAKPSVLKPGRSRERNRDMTWKETAMPTRARFVPILATLVLSAVAAAPAVAHAASRDWNQTFAVGARPAVHVRCDDARVHVFSGPDGAVKASVHWESRHWGFTSPSREPRVRLEKTADGVEVEVHEPAEFALFGGISERVTIELTVPAECVLGVHTGDGSIDVGSPLRGVFDLTTGDGHVSLHGIHGDVRVTSGDGLIEATDIDGSLVAHAGDGRIHVDGRFDVLDVRSGDGHVTVTARSGSRMASDWRVETDDAGLEVAIPRNLAADLDARTGDGRIHFDLPVTVNGRLDPHVIRGRLNGGGPALHLRTGDGTLTLKVSD